MKATGIVRRIDDLGRIVIPKEIRRTLRIREGDPLEIYTDSAGKVIFKKYSPVGEMSPFANDYAEVLSKSTSLPALICDRDHVVAVAGASKREFIERRITAELEDIMEQRQKFEITDNYGKMLLPVEGLQSVAACAYPIIAGGDVYGSVIVLESETQLAPSAAESVFKVAKISTELLSKQLED